jgi:type IV pilus assembly protein PilE
MTSLIKKRVAILEQEMTMRSQKGLRGSVRRSRARPAPGFTLIELMITVAVVAILGAIAYPSYQDFVQRSRRQEGKAALADAAARQEKFYLNNKTYCDRIGVPCTVPPGADLGMQATAGDYTIAVSPATAACPIVTCYALTAMPTPGGPQTGDNTKCGTLTVNSGGVKGATGPMPNDCW